MKPAILLLIALLAAACQRNAASPSYRATTARVKMQALEYQIYGLPELYYDMALRKTMQQYGVAVRTVAGCVVTDSLTKGVARNNQAVFAALDRCLGKGASERIMAEVEGRAKTQRRVESILREQKEIREKELQLKNATGEGSLTFNPYDIDERGFLQIKSDVLRYKSGEWQRAVWKSFHVDTARNAVMGLQ